MIVPALASPVKLTTHNHRNPGSNRQLLYTAAYIRNLVIPSLLTRILNTLQVIDEYRIYSLLPHRHSVCFDLLYIENKIIEHYLNNAAVPNRL